MIINEDMIKKEYIYALPTVVLISLATACHKCELNDVSMAKQYFSEDYSEKI